jgi:hypothetical protein
LVENSITLKIGQHGKTQDFRHRKRPDFRHGKTGFQENHQNRLETRKKAQKNGEDGTKSEN